MTPASPRIVIEYLAGHCPVEAEGTIDGKPFYFRARGAAWSLGIGGEPVGAPEWEYREPYGRWPDAGWMDDAQAEWLIRRGAMLWREAVSPAAHDINPASSLRYT